MDKEWAEFLKTDFVQGFPAYCGYEVDLIAEGEFHTSLKIRPNHKQQDGFVHAGVIATMADHTAGYAAFTTVTADFRILTIEFKINYFRPAADETIVCRSKVINRGKKIIVSESEVFSVSGAHEKLVSKAMVTLMAVPANSLNMTQTRNT
jgi:uncharacterized protein (TIGR00369 family)